MKLLLLTVFALAPLAHSLFASHLKTRLKNCLELSGFFAPVSMKTGEISSVDRAQLESTCDILIFPEGKDQLGKTKLLKLTANKMEEDINRQIVEIGGTQYLQVSTKINFYHPISENQFSLKMENSQVLKSLDDINLVSGWKIKIDVLVTKNYEQKILVSQFVVNTAFEDGRANNTELHNVLELRNVQP